MVSIEGPRESAYRRVLPIGWFSATLDLQPQYPIQALGDAPHKSSLVISKSSDGRAPEGWRARSLPSEADLLVVGLLIDDLAAIVEEIKSDRDGRWRD
ncbi:hypothetical protein EVAR_96689_1 [Eumeta japonica]|uniref:Uncharacterized protein n=1 Tax=Eumeta variegata TaxID=151549 RepID=A0A4C1WHA9_EUMVA|nr:hypothetical protein EVAR_96689_1 [Eumeta japonica]